MANKGVQGPLSATNSGPRPGGFPLGSAQSRAAARSLLAARKASDEDEIRFQVVSILDGKPVNLDGLAERLRAARLKDQAGGSLGSLPASQGGQNSGGERRADCLAERIRRARERVAGAQALDNTR